MHDDSVNEKPQYPGFQTEYINKLEFLEPNVEEGIPVYRVLSGDGKLIDESQDPKVWVSVYSIPYSPFILCAQFC